MYAFFINKQFCTCANAFPNEFTVRSYEYCAGKHWILYWIQENKTATYFLHHTFSIYSFFQEKTLGDISFKLETKIMNFMSVFF
jgi:hypothetical protein